MKQTRLLSEISRLSEYTRLYSIHFTSMDSHRVKSGKFGQTAKFGQPLCLFHSSNIGIKNKLTKQTVKILMRRLGS